MKKKTLRLVLGGLGAFVAYKIFKKKKSDSQNKTMSGTKSISKFDAIKQLESEGWDFDKSFYAQSGNSYGKLEEIRKMRGYNYRSDTGKSKGRAFFESLQRYRDKYIN